MVKGTPVKQSRRSNNGNNTTLDQYFILKKPDSHQPLTKNENYDSNTVSSNDVKQQLKKIVMASENKTHGTDHQRKPLTELADMTPNTKSTTRRQKPIKPSFVVLRDDNSQDQVDATEAQQQQQEHESNTVATTQSQYNTQMVPLVDTLDSQSSITSSPVALGNDSQDSFLGPGGIEFRVDAVESDNSDENDDDNEHYHHYYDNGDSPFFDDLGQVQAEDTHHYQQRGRQWWSYDTGGKRTHQQSLDSDDDDDDDETRRRVINRYASAPENDTSAYELSVYSPLSFPLDDMNIHNNDYNSSDDEDNIQPNARRPTPPIVQHQSSAPTSLSFSFSSPTLHSNTSLSDSNDPLTTLPISPLPLDGSFDLHVAYPVPRGTHIVDKFEL